MQESIIIRPIAGADRITLKTFKVFKEIQRELNGKTARVDYDQIGEAVGLTRHGVRYAVQTLVKIGALENKDGKLTVLKRIVL